MIDLRKNLPIAASLERSHEIVNDGISEDYCPDNDIDAANFVSEGNVLYKLPEPKLADISDCDAALLKLQLEKGLSNGEASSVAR